MIGVVLGGGLGTRLRSVVSTVPKVMAPVDGRPFLSYVLDQLVWNGVDRLLLSVCYKHEAILDWFGESYQGVPIRYAKESRPLGTGGAIKKALGMLASAPSCLSHNEPLLITNGDSFVRVDVKDLHRTFSEQTCDLAMVTTTVNSTDRYGRVLVEGDRIIRLQEKSSSSSSGYINCGFYMTTCELLERLPTLERFSFEEDFLTKRCRDLHFRCHPAKGYFIDIGVPADYQAATARLLTT